MEQPLDFKAFFCDVLGVQDDALLTTLADHAALATVRKGTRLLEAGSLQSSICFLVSGVVRCFSIDADGHEITDCLISDPGSVLSPTADLSAPAPSSVEVLSDSEIISIDLALVGRLLKTSLAANHLYIRLLTKAWYDHFETRRVVSQLRAKDRYLWFLDNHPDLINRVPNKYIASLLGMTPVTLSRLRADLRGWGVTFPDQLDDVANS